MFIKHRLPFESYPLVALMYAKRHNYLRSGYACGFAEHISPHVQSIFAWKIEIHQNYLRFWRLVRSRVAPHPQALRLSLASLPETYNVCELGFKYQERCRRPCFLLSSSCNASSTIDQSCQTAPVVHSRTEYGTHSSRFEADIRRTWLVHR